MQLIPEIWDAGLFQKITLNTAIPISSLSPIWNVFLASAFVYGFYYWFFVVDKVKLFYHANVRLHQKLVDHCPTFNRHYYPPIWLVTSHLQGPLGLVLRTNYVIDYASENLAAKDGGQLLLLWTKQNVKTNPNSPILVVFPGLTGGSDKPYLTHLIYEAQKRGWKCVVVIFPGCLISENVSNACKSPRFFSPADVSDVEVVEQHVRRLYPDSPLIGVGHSMGAAMLTKYIGKHPENQFSACISMSNPWNFHEVATQLDQFGYRHIYGRHFTEYWCSVVKQNADVFKHIEKIDFEAVAKCTTIKEFDEAFSKHIYGYSSTEKYHRDVSCVQDIKHIKTPFFVIHSWDDPMVPRSAFPLQELTSNPNCFVALTSRGETRKLVELTDTGGHSGWLEGFIPSGLCFADRLCLEYIDEFLSELLYQNQHGIGDELQDSLHITNEAVNNPTPTTVTTYRHSGLRDTKHTHMMQQ